MFRKILNILSTVVLIFLIAVVVLVFISRMSGNSPSVFGYHVFRVATDSMTPTLKVGDVILVKETAAEDIHNGDIITYNGTEGEFSGKVITHRVIADPVISDGVYFYQTMGDKEGAVADPQITYDQVEGRYVRSLPLIDKLYTFFLSPGGLIAFIALIFILFAYELISIILSYKAIDEKDDSYYAPPNKKPRHKRKKK